MRALFLKFVMILTSVHTVQGNTQWQRTTLNHAAPLNAARFHAVRLKEKNARKPVRDWSASWKPMCLNQLPKWPSKRLLSSSRTMLSLRDMKIFSNPDVSENRLPDGTLSLKGMPPEYVAILSSSAQNSSALMQDYAGVSGGMDLFGIRAMFVSPSTNSIISDFGATDLHHFL